MVVGEMLTRIHTQQTGDSAQFRIDPQLTAPLLTLPQIHVNRFNKEDEYTYSINNPGVDDPIGQAIRLVRFLGYRMHGEKAGETKSNTDHRGREILNVLCVRCDYDRTGKPETYPTGTFMFEGVVGSPEGGSPEGGFPEGANLLSGVKSNDQYYYKPPANILDEIKQHFPEIASPLLYEIGSLTILRPNTPIRLNGQSIHDLAQKTPEELGVGEHAGSAETYLNALYSLRDKVQQDGRDPENVVLFAILNPHMVNRLTILFRNAYTISGETDVPEIITRLPNYTLNLRAKCPDKRFKTNAGYFAAHSDYFLSGIEAEIAKKIKQLLYQYELEHMAFDNPNDQPLNTAEQLFMNQWNKSRNENNGNSLVGPGMYLARLTTLIEAFETVRNSRSNR